MEKLNNLFSYIIYFNKYAYPKLINSDKNYYYFNINNGYIKEISKTYLNDSDRLELILEAKRILNNYRAI